MHPNILTKIQVSLLPLVKQFNPSFYLVGGTALALQLGHRRAGEFNERLFRIQLAYHQDLDYSETIEYMPNFAVDDKVIKQKLTAISLT
ncbi:MAG: hypothetical protein Q8P91_02155 [bacterium]|nr:hypothetical protein [bacterium]